MKTPVILPIASLLFLCFACQHHRENTIASAFEPRVLETRGRVVSCDSLPPPVTVKAGNPRLVPAGRPSVTMVPSNAHTAQTPETVIAGAPEPCTPGQDTFKLPQKTTATGKTVFAGTPEVVAVSDAHTKDYNPYNFSSFYTLQGLSGSIFTSLCQDRSGNIWIGSRNAGIIRYDGKYFTDFTAKEGLQSNNINTALADTKGRLWFGTNDKGVICYDGRTFTRFSTQEGLSDNTVRCMAEDKNGDLWIGTENGGVNRYDGKTFRCFTRREGLGGNSVISMAIDRNGNLWFGLQDGGVSRFDGKSFFHYTEKEGFGGSNVSAICEDENGNLWFALWGIGVCRYDGRNFSHFTEKEGLESNMIQCILKDKNGNLWFGCWGQGVCRYDGKSFFHFTDSEGFPNNFIFSMLEDKSGNIWFSTFTGGVVKYNGNAFRRFSENDGLVKKEVFSIQEDKAGKLWLGVFGGGLSRYNGQFFTNFSEKEGLQDNYILSVAVCKNGDVWTGDRVGVCKYDGKYFAHFTIKEGLCGNAIWSVLEDHNCNMWFGSDGSGVAKYDGRSFTRFTTREGLSGNVVWAIIEDHNHNLWFGTRDNGVTRYDGKTFTHFTQTEGLSSNRISSIAEDRNGNLWFGTLDGGVNKYDGKTITCFTTTEGLCSNEVWSILVDRTGNLWFGTNNGLSKLDRNFEEIRNRQKEGNPSRDDRTPVLFRNFTYENGFWGLSCIVNSIHEDKNGVIWTGTDVALTAFQPGMDMPDTMAPDIQLTKLSLFNENIGWQNLEKKQDSSFVVGNGARIHDLRFDSLSQWNNLPENLSLAYDNNYLRFDFVGTATLSPSKIKYQYMLEGLDRQWNTPTKSTEAVYTNLSPGAYTFSVKAVSGTGYWSREQRYTFTIRPPWWASWWAYLFYAVLFFGSIFFLYRFQLKRRLEHAETLRLQELDAVKSNLYTNITHEFRTPITVILGMARQVLDQPKEYFRYGLDMIIRNGQDLLHLVNQMLDLSKLESGKLSLHYRQGDVVGFLKYVAERFYTLARSKNIQIHLLNDMETLAMDFDAERLQQIVANLLSNAIKFTPEGGQIYFSVDSSDHFLIIKIRDTGTGISEDHLAHIFDRFYQANDGPAQNGGGTGIGLTLAKELVTLMEGDISVKSAPGKGATFTVTLPVRHTAEWGAGFQLKEKQGPRALPPRPAVFTSSAAKPLVLIAEDNADVVAYLSSFLSGDYRLAVANDGQECEEIAFETVPDLIVTDVMMPRKDGFEVCTALKKDERTSHIPIVMLTAKADMESKLEGLERGADAYLMKPFHREELLVRIKKLLELRVLMQQRYLSLAGLSPENAVEKDIPPASDIEHAFVTKARAIVEMHLADYDFDVEKFCRALALSHPQVHRKLCSLTGLSANRFIRTIRLNKAKTLLSDPEMSVTAVAFDSGFGDPSYFGKIFKQQFGYTPLEWRKRQGKRHT